jgi:hypothetical protein
MDTPATLRPSGHVNRLTPTLSSCWRCGRTPPATWGASCPAVAIRGGSLGRRLPSFTESGAARRRAFRPAVRPQSHSQRLRGSAAGGSAPVAIRDSAFRSCRAGRTARTIDDEELNPAATRRTLARRKRAATLTGLEPAVARRRLYGYLARRGFDLNHIRERVATAMARAPLTAMRRSLTFAALAMLFRRKCGPELTTPGRIGRHRAVGSASGAGCLAAFRLELQQSQTGFVTGLGRRQRDHRRPGAATRTSSASPPASWTAVTPCSTSRCTSPTSVISPASTSLPTRSEVR